MKILPLIAVALSAAALVAPVAAFAANDAAFLDDAIKGDNSETALGALAASRGASAATRRYGQMLVRDHSAHRMKVAALDRALGFHPTSALSEAGIQAKQMMLGLHGAGFDAAFKQHMIEDHQKDIAEYQDQANSGQSARVRQMAQVSLPTLQKHLAAAQAL